jgi:hypothetical protein
MQQGHIQSLVGLHHINGHPIGLSKLRDLEGAENQRLRIKLDCLNISVALWLLEVTSPLRRIGRLQRRTEASIDIVCIGEAEVTFGKDYPERNRAIDI